MVEHENRITAVEVEVRHVRETLDEMNDTLRRLVEEFNEFKGEARARWKIDDAKREQKRTYNPSELLKNVIIVLVSALLALAGVRMESTLR